MKRYWFCQWCGRGIRKEDIGEGGGFDLVLTVCDQEECRRKAKEHSCCGEHYDRSSLTSDGNSPRTVNTQLRTSQFDK